MNYFDRETETKSIGFYIIPQIKDAAQFNRAAVLKLSEKAYLKLQS